MTATAIKELSRLLEQRNLSPSLVTVIDEEGGYFAATVGDEHEAPAAFPLSIDFEPEDDRLSIGPLAAIPKLRSYGEWRLDAIPDSAGPMLFLCSWIEAAVLGRLALVRGAWSSDAVLFGTHGVCDIENVATVGYGFDPDRPYEVVRRFAPLKH